MRITDQMLNESARKAGLPINQRSLLDYVNDDTSGSLADALSRENNTVTRMRTQENYEKLEATADRLILETGLFLETGEDSIFDRAEESGSHQEIYDGVKGFVNEYNETVKALESTTGVLSDYYRDRLKEAASGNREELNGIGITICKDGTLSIDQEKLMSADPEQVKKVFGTSDTFLSRTAILAAQISDHAQANVQSLSNQYDSKGNTYSALLNKYNFWG